MTTAPTRRRRTGRPQPAPAPQETREAALRDELTTTRNDLELLALRLHNAELSGGPGWQPVGEAVADLERAIAGDPGWRAFAVLTQQEFSPEGMVQLRAVCRLMALANPLIKRGLDLRATYVWGQGVHIAARATGRTPETGAKGPKEQDVDAVVAAFLDDTANKRAVFGAQVADELEHSLGTDGEVFIALFTRPASGWVQARPFTADEVTEIITDPDDRCTPWYYRRSWDRTDYDNQGNKTTIRQELLYPDVDYKPRRKPARFAGVDIAWDAPVVHIAVNRPTGWLRGIPDAYSSIPWARAYKEFLEQWAGLMRSLARFAWRTTAEGKNRAQVKAAVSAATTTATTVDTRPAGTAGGPTTGGITAVTPSAPGQVGAVAITPPTGGLEAIPKTGATIDAASGRPIAMMVAAGMGVPVTMLLSDPGQTGARATAETLDMPLQRMMESRQGVWQQAIQRILRHVITEAVRAPQGPLKGRVDRDRVTDREYLVLSPDTDTTIDVTFPDLDDVEALEKVQTVMAAAASRTIPPEMILRMLLQALGVKDVDSIIEKLTDDTTGEFLWPSTGMPAGPGQQAADLARTGGDPAAAGTGPMAPGQPGQPGQPGDPAAAGAPGAPAAAVASTPALSRQADFDAGLFGGNRQDTPDAEPQQAEPAGPAPTAYFDPAFFTFGPGQADTAEGDDVEPTQEASRRQADFDAGLFGANDADDVPPGTGEPEPAGERPDPDAPNGFDKKLFTFD